MLEENVTLSNVVCFLLDVVMNSSVTSKSGYDVIKLWKMESRTFSEANPESDMNPPRSSKFNRLGLLDEDICSRGGDDLR